MAQSTDHSRRSTLIGERSDALTLLPRRQEAVVGPSRDPCADFERLDLSFAAQRADLPKTPSRPNPSVKGSNQSPRELTSSPLSSNNLKTVTTNPQCCQHSPLSRHSEEYPYPSPHAFGWVGNQGIRNSLHYIPGNYCPLGQLHLTDSRQPSPTHSGSAFSRLGASNSTPENSTHPYSGQFLKKHATSLSAPADGAARTRRREKWSALFQPVAKFATEAKRRIYSPKAVTPSKRIIKKGFRELITDEVLEPLLKAPDIPLTMASSRLLDPAVAMAAITKQRADAIRLAKEQGNAVAEMCRRGKTEAPPYIFDELIGKGAYGRVYKSRLLPSKQVVAVKVLDIDKLDYEVTRDFKDESIKDFIHETKVMQRVKDAGAKNINQFIEAFSIHSQLWLVCEYCPGGSVKTLMRATGNKLEEKFIIPVARELAEGLKAIHDAGIIHRDVKAANVLIHEEGNLQICDFGVAGILQSQLDKRSTWIGTPHWMPPEMFSAKGGEAYEYSSEIDVWAYGCTLFECATGNPPNANLRERMQIGRQLNRYTPKLDGEGYSDDLRALVSFSLDSDPKTRPSMQDILQHSYVMDSTTSHPTESLRDLVARYYQWLQRGGQRISLFNPGGAAAAEMPDDSDDLDRGSWNFSTTDGFQKRFSILDLDQLSESLAALESERTPTATQAPPREPTITESPEAEVTPEQRANFDERVRRGAVALEGLFDESKPTYKYETKADFVPVTPQQPRSRSSSSDLPLRTETDRSSVTSTLIDINLGDFESAHYAAGSANQDPPFQLADADTIRANRSSRSLRNSSSAGSEQGSDFHTLQQRGPRPPTMEWTFPSMETDVHNEPQPGPGEEDGSDDEDSPPRRQDKRDTRTWTFPVMTAEEETDTGAPERSRRDSEGSMANMSFSFPSLQPAPLSSGRHDRATTATIDTAESRPSTSTSAQSAASDADYDPFKFDRQGPPGEMDQFPSLVDSEEYDGFDSEGQVGFPGGDQPFSSESSSEFPGQGERTTESASGTDQAPLRFPDPVPPSNESLLEGAQHEITVAELDRVLGDFIHGLAVVGESLARWEEVGEEVEQAQ